MSEHSAAIDRIYKLAKKFKGLVPGGLSQVGEIPKKKAGSRKRRIQG